MVFVVVSGTFLFAFFSQTNKQTKLIEASLNPGQQINALRHEFRGYFCSQSPSAPGDVLIDVVPESDILGCY